MNAFEFNQLILLKKSLFEIQDLLKFEGKKNNSKSRVNNSDNGLK